MADKTIKIDREFASLCPALAEEELKQLEESLQAVGCQQPLVLWKGHDILLDGHNRHTLCKKLKLDFKTVEVDLPDREAARSFILHTQLGRRNLTNEAASYLRGKRYLELKNQGKRTDLDTSGQSDHKKLSDRMAEEYKVGERTIRRDALFAEAIDAIVEGCGAEYRQVLLSRQYRLTRGNILALAKLKVAAQKKYLDELTKTGKRPRKERAKGKPALDGLVQRILKQDRDKALVLLQKAAKELGMKLVKGKAE
jgi:hypothetical protein